MTEPVAYRTNDGDVLNAFQTHLETIREIQDRRDEVEARYGRELVAVGSGFGHGSTVVGFEREPKDENDPALKAERRRYWSVPRMGTTAGKALADELARLSMPGPVLPGMPEFKLVSSGQGIGTIAPGILEIDGTIWVTWAREIDDDPKFDSRIWEQVPLSVYYAAKEADDAAKVAAQ